MDALDRFFLHLVRTLRATQPHLLTAGFDVAELYQSILPYRHHRRALGLETNQDYEMALLELLSGARGYLLVDERMRDALTQELSTPNPDPGRFREFGSSQVGIAPGAADRIEAEAAAGATEQPKAAPSRSAAAPPPPPVARPSITAPVSQPPAGAPRPSTQAPPPPQGAPAAGAGAMNRSLTPAGTAGRLSTPVHQRGVLAHGGDKCRYCSAALPAGRMVVFCPSCGQDLSIRNCPACGSELELGWRFCVSCGRGVAAEQGG